MSLAKDGVYDCEKNPMYGVHLYPSDERRKQISLAVSGEKNPMYGKPAVKTPVLCVETNTVYESRCAAARDVGIESGRISRAIKRGGKAGGYHWVNIA